MASEQAPTHITYNPVYMATYEGSDPTRGYVYVLETARPTPVTPVSSQGIVISNRFYEHLIALTGYHITRPPTPDHEFVNVCNGDLRKLSDFMDTVAPVSPDAIGKCGELVTVAKQHRLIRDGYPGSWQPYASPIFSDDVFETRELVTRSQAEELLAAERAENAELKRDRRFKQHVIDGLVVDKENLKADNAAKDARVRELQRVETELCTSIGLLEDKLNAANGKIEALVQSLAYETAHEATKRAEALETKLAAAEKALEPFANAADGRKSKSVTGAVCFSQHYLLAARAALGGKPS